MVAPECLAAFCTASRQQKYAVASTPAAYLPTPSGRDLDGDRAGRDGQRQGSDESVGLERGGIDAPREGQQHLDGLGRGPLLLRQQRLGAFARTSRQGLGEPQVHGQRDQVLLGAVVDVALE